MKSGTTARFWERFNLLPDEVQRRTLTAYELWRENPHHPSLQFMRKGPYWSARVTDSYRVLGRL